MSKKFYGDDEDFAGRDRKRDRNSAKELRKAQRKNKAQGQSEWMELDE